MVLIMRIYPVLMSRIRIEKLNTMVQIKSYVSNRFQIAFKKVYSKRILLSNVKIYLIFMEKLFGNGGTLEFQRVLCSLYL